MSSLSTRTARVARGVAIRESGGRAVESLLGICVRAVAEGLESMPERKGVLGAEEAPRNGGGKSAADSAVADTPTEPESTAPARAAAATKGVDADDEGSPDLPGTAGGTDRKRARSGAKDDGSDNQVRGKDDDEDVARTLIKRARRSLHERRMRVRDLPPGVKDMILHHLVRAGRAGDLCVPSLCYPGMRVLDMRWSPRLAGPSLFDTAATWAGSLQTLNLTGCKRLKGECLVPLAETAKHLTRLVLDGCAWHLDDATASAFARHCVSLRVVNLSRCVKLTDKSLGMFAGLEEMLLDDCVSVSDVGVEALTKGSPSLTSLSLLNCPGLTDQALTHVSRHNPLLRNFRISRARAVGDQGVDALAKGCIMLRRLVLSFLPRLTDLSAASAARLSALSHLSLTGCDKVTDAGVGALCSGCPRLQELSVAWCARVTVDGARLVAARGVSLVYYRSGAHNQISAGAEGASQTLDRTAAGGGDGDGQQ